MYTGPLALSGTYRAVAIQDDWTSPMATVTFAGGSLFTDFTSDDWYFDYVDDAVSLGLFFGRGNEFDPTQTITRAEFAADLARFHLREPVGQIPLSSEVHPRQKACLIDRAV